MGREAKKTAKTGTPFPHLWGEDVCRIDMKVLTNPQIAVLRKGRGQVTRTPCACLKDDGNTHGQSWKRGSNPRGSSGGQAQSECQGTATDSKVGRDSIPASAISHWPRLPRGHTRPQGCGSWPPPPPLRSPPRSQPAPEEKRGARVGPVTPFGAVAASGSLNPAAAGGTSLPAGARLSNWLRPPGAGPGTWVRKECGM